MTVSVALPCGSVGKTQTVTVTTEPGAVVLFDNTYADGKDGQTHGGFEKKGQTDARGVYSTSWLIQPGTPSGDVRLDVAAAGKHAGATKSMHWTVGNC